MNKRRRFPVFDLFAALLAATLICVALQARAVQQQTRTSGFEYYPVGHAHAGLLKKEIIEPGDSNLCLVTEYDYDGFGNRKSATTRNCNGSSYGFGSSTFNEASAPTGTAVFTSRTSSTGFTTADASGCATPPNYVAGRFPIKRTNALGQFECLEHKTNFGTVSKLTGPNNLATSWTFDNFSRKSTESRADGTGSTWTYTISTASSFSALSGVQYAYYVTETSTGAPTKYAYYDILNRQVGAKAQSFSGSTLISSGATQYDSRGRVSKVYEPYYDSGSAGAFTMGTYDDLNRPVTVTAPSGAVTTTTYNGLTITASVDPDGAGSRPAQTKKTVKNSQGQVLSVRTNEGSAEPYVDTTISYAYNPFGNLLTTTDLLGNVTTLSYDNRGRKTQMLDPDMGTWTYRYNALGELLWQCDPVSRSIQSTGNPPDCTDSSATRMSYDLLGRMLTRTERDLTSTWVWDTATKGVGKLASVSSSNGYSRTHSYDSYGRPESNTVTIGPDSFTTIVSYDSSSRVNQITYPYNATSGGFAASHVYTSTGYLSQVRKVSGDVLLWQANSVSASGKVLNETLGSNLTVARTYNSADGLATVYTSGVQDDTFTYDLIGNLTQRVDAIHSVTENATYDSLNRLRTTSGPSITTRDIQYNAIGNITYKSDVGTYSYPNSGSSSVRPHAVSSVSATTGGITATYGYDANGNLTSASGTIWSPDGSSSVSFSRSLTYMSFNLPSVINHTQGSSSYSYTYTYGPDHERVKLVTVRPDDTITSLYVHPNNSGGLSYEREYKQSNGEYEHKYYVTGGAGLVGVFVVKSTGLQEMRYYHRDHLGSIVAITGPTGSILQALAYEAFGERRNTDGSTLNRIGPLIGMVTDRGFTTHEHLDEMNLIHMNGRIYDPALGRFLTADSALSDPFNAQSYNRYAYVLNNPLAFTDPSGHCEAVCVLILVVVGAEAAHQLGIIDKQDARLIQGIALAAALGLPNGVALAGTNAFANALIGGFVGGAVSGGSLESGFYGALSAGLFNGAGGIGQEGSLGRLGAHAAAGCISAAASGGDCGPGALAAGLTETTVGGRDFKTLEANIAIRAIIGGTASVLGGGKFANGAKTAAFAYLFNQCAHGGCSSLDRYEGQPGYGHLNPNAGGGISFVNDVPGGASTDRAIDLRLVSTVETSINITGDAINVNSTTGGHASGPHPAGRALDVNVVNGIRVMDPASYPAVRALTTVLSRQPYVGQIISPVLSINISPSGQLVPITSQTLLNQHVDHIHIGVRP